MGSTRRNPVTGFVSNAGRTWHADAACPAMGGPTTATVHGATFSALAWDSAADGILRCHDCTLPVVLDEVADRSNEPGYHALACDTLHCDRLHDGTGCPRCAALTRYGRQSGALIGRIGERTAILRTGAGRLPAPYLNMWYLELHTAHGEHLPTITAPMWVAAAALLGGRFAEHRLGEALTCAAGLYTPAGRP